jgi:cyclophilin family peptidyl-prolyl cis-trans isomerase/HEAT repeat protein
MQALTRSALLALLLAAGCAPARAPGELPAPAPVRLAADDITSVALLLRMEDGRRLDTALVARLLADPLPEVRGRAAFAAGRLRDPAATPLLLRAATDPDPAVRGRAAFALGVAGDTSAAVIEALTALAAGARAQPAPAREAAAALGLLASPAGRPALEALLGAGNVPAIVRHEALLAIWRLPRAATTVPAVAPWLTAGDAETRWRAAYALWRVGGVDAVPLLLAALADGDDRVRANAARGLRAPLADSAGLRSEAFASALAAAADPHPHVRINALRLLPAYRDNDRALPVLIDRLRDEDANTAVAAAQALAETADPRAAAALAAAARDAALPDGLRSAALTSWLRLDSEAAATTVEAWAADNGWLLRMHAAVALAALPAQRAAPVLERLARDAHPLVASRALAALGPVTDSLPVLRRLFHEQLASPHVLVRAAAVTGLGREATAADLDVLLLAYDRARADPTREAAMAAVTALGRLIRAGVPADRAFFARFGPTGPPGDAAVHRAIVQQIGPVPAAWGTPAVGPEARPLAFYEDVVRRLVAPVLAGEPAPRVAIATLHGDIVLEMAAADAPLTVHNFLSLLDRGYYAGTRWHRVVPNFVLQDGDPRGDGSGGPGHVIRDEINPLRYARGALGMALSGPDTGGSQFFITHSPQPHLDGGYTIFGRVVDGMDAADRVVQDEPIAGFRRLE